MPTGTRPVTGLLSTYLAACERNGWNPASRILMKGPDDDDLTDEERTALEALTPEQVTALDGLTDEEFDALDALSDEDLAKLQPPTVNDPLKRLRNEAARRRNELKPWKAIAKDFDLTPDEVRAIVEASIDDDDGDDPKVKRQKPKERRQRRDTAADDRANLKAIKVEVKSAAGDLFADPGDAHLYLDLDKYEVDEDGDLLDPDELLDDLAEVLEQKPHLAKRERKGPKPIPGQGRRDAKKTSGLDAGRERARARYGTSNNGDS